MKFFLMLLIVSAASFAAPVIDLGKTQVQGKMRGPSLEVIESGRLDAGTTARAALLQLKSLEEVLTRPAPPPKKREAK